MICLLPDSEFNLKSILVRFPLNKIPAHHKYDYLHISIKTLDYRIREGRWV